jgi:hypothetical protein
MVRQRDAGAIYRIRGQAEVRYSRVIATCKDYVAVFGFWSQMALAAVGNSGKELRSVDFGPVTWKGVSR